MDQIYKKNNVIKAYGLLLIEGLAFAVSLMTAVVIRYKSIQAGGSLYVHFAIVQAAFMLLYATMTDWNRDFFIRGYYKEAAAVLRFAVSTSVGTSVVMYVMEKNRPVSRTVFGIYISLFIVITYMLHLIFKEYMLKYYRKGAGSDKLTVVTTSDRAAKVINDVKTARDWNTYLTGVVIVDKDMRGEKIGGIPVTGSMDEIMSGEMGGNIVDRVFISLPGSISIEDVKTIIYEYESMGVVCHYDVGLEELDLSGKEAGSFAGYPVLSFSMQNLDYRRLMIKRLFDIAGSLIGILITAVLFPFIAFAIKSDSKGPVIFKQERVGKNGRHFYIYKFRSMYKDAEKRLSDLADKNEMSGLLFKMEDDPRITKVGKFIRKTSIDELPQFFNILKGDMSLVGTRPPTVSEYERYSAYHKRRLAITPGLTGLWQVSGRSDITDFDEVVKLDLKYIDSWSLSLDVKILLQTVVVVLFRKGAK